ncbi:shikimate dehydrogenase [Paraburkholderia bonniea]|uniref:shikimate dehydrogenase n=1 Tax=Paraburkholderia bonniea TaxID=2152891 RepID=UPI00129138C7|nr:shikimate dehydrogenase [Paraburkholderia bonniea]WJF89884.1 shikimate dehydrogenase [Paraburkholderia bonniea]WJF93198.1 shikimate dehydrogenase [Paraburkholderia bonniea]
MSQTHLPDRYVVMGNPVEHSKSPRIHALFAQQTGEPLEYGRLCPAVEAFEQEALAFFADGGRGANVTVPFKLRAFALASKLSPRAMAAGAVNTLRQDASGIYGDNTDGVGLVRDIEVNLQRPLGGQRILLLGAGGAAQGVVLPLLERGPAQLTIANRTAATAQALASRFAAAAASAALAGTAAAVAACTLTGGGPQQIEPQAYDIIINATAGSLDGALPECDERAFGPGTLAYDMMYSAQPTVFMQHARALGARAEDGLGMLVEQAAEAFFVWRDKRPDSAPVLKLLRDEMRASGGAV